MLNSNQSIIQIKRRRQNFNGSLAVFHLHIDNVEVGKLKNGQDASFNIAPGTHSIRITMAFQKVPEILFNINVGEIIEFETGFEVIKGPFLRQITNKAASTSVKQNANSTPQIPNGDLTETTHHNDTDIYSEDEFPIDNRFGSEALTVEHEVSKTASNELVIDSKADKSGSFGADVSFFKAQIAASISKQIGHTIGESITRKQRFTFTVKPGQISIYKIVWKRKVRSGEYLISVNNKLIPIAYRVEYDLVCEVRSVGPST